MITLPDFKEKQLLYIQTKPNIKTKIRFVNDNIVFSKDDQIVNRISCHKVFAVFIIGDISITSGLIREGTRHGISFFFLRNNMETYASVNSFAEGHYLLRMKQYALSKERQLNMAKNLIANKIDNQVRLLKEQKIQLNLVTHSKKFYTLLEQSINPETILGVEGNASKQFFSEYFNELNWKRRSPRTKSDIPNFLLDIGYSMLFNFVDSLLRLYGFDTYMGFYHKLFFQRRSLACDVVEPFRCLIDKRLLIAYRLGQINAKDFIFKNGRLQINYQNSYKYSEIFLTELTDHKEQVYSYVRELYRYIMNNEGDIIFPSFKIKTWS